MCITFRQNGTTYASIAKCCLFVRATCYVDLLRLDHIELCVDPPFQVALTFDMTLASTRIVDGFEAVHGLVAQLRAGSSRGDIRSDRGRWTDKVGVRTNSVFNASSTCEESVVDGAGIDGA
jgi:hypothetical protein